MKINDSKPIAAASPPDPAQPAERLVKQDRVSIERARELQSSLASVRENTSASRTSRLHELTNLVKAGQYRPDAGRIAERILQAAEIDAEFRAMLTR
jgi:negative regulator of flagellin synthesis FlgM